EGSRGSLPGYGWLRERLTDPGRAEQVRRLAEVAARLDVPLAQLAIAWCAANPNVSSVITGASRVEQVEQNLDAVQVLALRDEEVMAVIDGIAGEGDDDR